MKIIFALIALLLGAVGSQLLTQATLGVGCIAGGCLIAIFARIFQAHDHQNSLLKEIEKVRVNQIPNTPASL